MDTSEILRIAGEIVAVLIAYLRGKAAVKK